MMIYDELKAILNDEEIREKGFFRYILIVGIFKIGFTVTAYCRLIDYFLTHGPLFRNSWEILTVHNIAGFIGQAILEGIIFGSIVWFYGKPKNYPKFNGR